tara:strand:- start:670 stop:930 length:261 start_codon:yes stop_codon:yes gene_type:complete
MLPSYGLVISFLTGTANAFIFSFFHNGMMYKTRNDLNKRNYPKGWWDQSTNSTAWSTKLMTPLYRSIQLVIGLIIYIITFYLIGNQ